MTDLETMEQAIVTVISKMNQHEGIKRSNSLTVLAQKFNQLERRCLLLAKSEGRFTKKQVETAYKNAEGKIIGDVSINDVLKRMEVSGLSEIDKSTLSISEMVCIQWGLDNED